MLDQKVSFSDNARSLHDFFESQGVLLPPDLYRELLGFLSKACIYEEEERKIRPSLVIGSNLLDSRLKQLMQATIIPFVVDPLNNSHLAKRLKSSLPFCNNGWRVFINTDGENITYGIMRNFNGPSGLNVEQILGNLTSDDKEELQTNFVLIDVTSNFEIMLKGNNRTCTIDFRLVEDTRDINAQDLFCKDLLSAYNADISKVSVAYSKTINMFSQKLHGSICVIIKHDHMLPDETLKDGIFLDVPIDIYPILADDLNDRNLIHNKSSTISSHERYHAFTGVLLEMLNIDGITVVDNKGRIRAFNVFVKPDASGNEALSGGARKRAAAYLTRQANPNYIGVYFQSQDGMISYERISDYE